ncbi:AMP-binding protein [Ramlibacter sp. PS4R-6]|uniref:AMP-binding protein n=1 Tax=Ramlibacter sp. PS4R-6 TaxID=3133438 RepID=UPI0030981D97
MTSTVLEQIERQAAATPDAIAIAAHGRSPLAYRQLVAHIRATAEALNRAGAGRGDRVGIVMPGGPEMATAVLSVAAAAVATPVNPDFKQAEYEQNLKRLKVKLVLTLAGGQHPVRAAAKALGLPVVDVKVDTAKAAGLFELAAAPGAKAAASGLAQPDDVALILQTSGTTSVPKTVPLTQRNLVASARNLIASLQLTAADRCLHFLPMFHIGGVVDVLIAPLMAGGGTFIQPSFASGEFYRDLKAWRPTWTQAVPVMQQELVNTADAHEGELAGHQLRFLRSVSAPLPVPLMEAVEKRFGIPVIEIFGMTEAAGMITSNRLPPGKRKPGCVGASAGMEVRILGGNNEPLGTKQIGEVVIRGDNLMAGYEDNPEENARLFSDAGFRTGDLGFLDEDGYLVLTGRVKDMINRGGEKVSPHEVDQLLLSHPAVADAASFPVPHPTLGEDVGAVVVLRSGAKASADDLKAYLRERIAFFKIPRLLRFVDEIPRGANGKLQRAVLTEKFGKLEDAAAERAAFVAPEGPVAKQLAQVWSEILQVEEVGMDSDFFELGGDSLKAASLINAVQQRWGDTIYVSSVFDAPTLGRYAKFLEKHYPELVARMLGQSVAPKAQEPKITPQMVTELRTAIAKSAPKPWVPKKKNPPAIFVLSPPRSGSTLLRAMLAGHPKLFSPPELYLLTYNTLADRKAWFSGSQRFQLEGNIRALMQIRQQPLEEVQAWFADLEAKAFPTQEYYGLLQQWLGDQWLTDKTPAYATHLETLERGETWFEDTIYIHLLRHPYGMIRSFEEAKLEQLWYPRLVGQDAGHPDASPYGRRQLGEMIWLILHENIVKFLDKIPANRKFQLRFEDMVNQPEAAMRDVCTRLGLDFAPDMLAPQGDQKQRMTDGIHEGVSRMIGDPKFHKHKKIEASVADQWKSAYEVDFLSEQTLALAKKLGYTETVADVRGREDIEL